MSSSHGAVRPRGRARAGILLTVVALIVSVLTPVAAEPVAHDPGVPRAGNLIEVAAGDRHSCGLDGDGSIWCWGDNRRGQLGVQLNVETNLPHSHRSRWHPPPQEPSSRR